MLAELSNFLTALPATVWGAIGAVIAGIIALTGVMLTNRSNERRFRGQLEHDKDLRQAERTWTFKREILTRAHKDILEAFHLLPTVLHCDSQETANVLEKVRERLTAIAGVLLVCDSFTHRKAVAILGGFSKVMAETANDRTSLDVIDRKSTVKIDRIKAISADISRLSDVAKSTEIQSVKDSIIMEMESKQSEMQTLDGESDLEMKQLFDSTIEACRKFQKRMEPLGSALDEFSNEARRELLIPTLPADQLAHITNIPVQEGQQAMDVFLADLEKKVAAMSDKGKTAADRHTR